MADLFVRQGHPEQAIPIYEKLLAAEPQSAVLREKLTSARAALAAKQPQPAAESTPSDLAMGAVPPMPEADESTRPPDGPQPVAWSEPAPSPALSSRDRLTKVLGNVRSRRRAPAAAPALAGRD